MKDYFSLPACTLPAKAGIRALTQTLGFIILAAVTRASIPQHMHGLWEMTQKARTKKRPWNQGKTVGQRRPFTPRELQAIRYALEQERNARDLALLNTAIDTMLRASDLLALKVEDVTDHMGTVVEDVVLQQQKTKIGTIVTLSDRTRRALEHWMAFSLKMPSDYLFTGERRHRPLSRSQ